MAKNTIKTVRFTYGHQFEPEKFSLEEITQLCQDYEPNRDELEKQILIRYFAEHSQESSSQSDASSNQKKLAMNFMNEYHLTFDRCPLTARI